MKRAGAPLALASRLKYGVIKPFDPWSSPLCTCPPKLVVNPYTGCGHACLYCYATSYIVKPFEPRPKSRLLERLERDIEILPEDILVELSTSTDPYQPLESRLQLTRRMLYRLALKRLRVLITTKSPTVARDLRLLLKIKPRVAVAITITTPDPRVSRIIEPGAPSPQERIAAVRILSREKIPVVVRIDPIVPGVNDRLESVRHLVNSVARAGALQVTCSTFKARPDSIARLKRALPRAAGSLEHLYLERGERVQGYRYLERALRLQLLKAVKEIVEEEGMAFQTCREGFSSLDTPGFACDGSTFTFEDV
uniref:Radical SAM protein n=1 Tax=Fervidicoccus fontis TaxID=683846 RepID=A0A7J3ZKS2_9CREN